MKKAIIGIFISFGAIFLMSHNASALTNTLYLSNGVYAYGWPADLGSESGSPIYLTANQSYNNQNNIYLFQGVKDYSYMAFWYNNAHSAVDYSDYTDYSFSFTYCGSHVFYSPVSNNGFPRTYYSETVVDSSKYIADFRNSTTNDVYIGVDYKCSNVFLMGKLNTKVSPYFVLGNTAAGQFTRLFSFDPYSNARESSSLVIISPILTLYTNEDEAANALKEEKQSVQDASNNSQSSGNSSQSDSQNATSSLLSVFTGFANVITNASPTSCVINAPLNTTFSSDRLNVDLCGLDLPPAIGALTSIIAVMVVVPFAISMFNKFIGIMQGFQK